MRPRCPELASLLAEPIRRFVACKRVLNRRFHTEDRALHLFDRYLTEHGVAVPRSYNHLLGVVRRLFDWLVDQAILDVSPVRSRPRRETARRIPYLFDPPHACRLIEIAAALPDHNRAPQRGKGDKWRTCPLWPETARLLHEFLAGRLANPLPDSPAFTSRQGGPLTRFGIYKLIRRRARRLPTPHIASCAAPYHGGTPARSRRRGQRHSRLARPCQSGHDQPLCRDQYPPEGSRATGLRTSKHRFGGIPPKTRMAG